MDKNGKIFGKISIIDLFAILLVLGVIAGTVYRYVAPSASVTSGEKKITYVLKINGVRPFTTPFYTEGLKCYDSWTEDFIGEIKDIRVEPLKVTQTLDDGIPFKAVHPNGVVIYLTIEADGRETEDAFYANGTYKLKVGSEIHLATKYVNVTTTIEKVEGISSLNLDE